MRMLAAIVVLGAFLGTPPLTGWIAAMSDEEQWTREALDLYLRDLDESRMANFLGCLVDPKVNPDGNGPTIALASWKIIAVRIEHDSLRFQADVVLVADAAHSRSAVGLPKEPVAVTLGGEVTHEHHLSFMYFIPNISVENRTSQVALVARNGLRIDLDESVFDAPAAFGTNLPTIEVGAPLALALSHRMPLQQAPGEQNPPSELHYGEAQVQAHAGETLHFTVTSTGPRPLRVFVRHPGTDVLPIPIQAQLIPDGGTREFALRLPVDAPLYLRAWTDGYGAPPGGCTVSLQRSSPP